MHHIKVEILLPLYYNEDSKGNRKKVEGTKFAEIYENLVEKFGGCVINKSPLISGWFDPSTKKYIQDECNVCWVICHQTDSNIEFFYSLKEILKKKLEQKEILMYFLIIDKF